jgi:hypothetical protein
MGKNTDDPEIIELKKSIMEITAKEGDKELGTISSGRRKRKSRKNISIKKENQKQFDGK